MRGRGRQFLVILRWAWPIKEDSFSILLHREILFQKTETVSWITTVHTKLGWELQEIRRASSTHRKHTQTLPFCFKLERKQFLWINEKTRLTLDNLQRKLLPWDYHISFIMTMILSEDGLQYSMYDNEACSWKQLWLPSQKYISNMNWKQFSHTGISSL